MADKPDFDLSGKVALITGASRGIGRAIAEAYAAAGAGVVLSSRKQPALDEVAAAIRADGGEALPMAAHTGDEEAIEALVAQAHRRLTTWVTPRPIPASACAGRPYHRLNEDYRPLHALCHFFLENSGPGHGEGDQAMLPFLADMGRLYEQFVAEWLRRHLPAGWTLRAQETVSLKARRGSLRFQPDLVLYDLRGKAWVVLDTKYKTSGGPAAGPVARDVAQVVAYAQGKGCREAVLIYPEPLSDTLDVHVGDIRVRTLPFTLNGPLDDQGQAFLDDLALPAPSHPG